MASPLPALPTESSPWDQALYAFLVEKGNRSGSKRTVESYSRMLWRFFADTTPDRVTPAVVLAYAHGIGLSGKPPSLVTIGARIACLSSYFKFLIRMGMVTSDPCRSGRHEDSHACLPSPSSCVGSDDGDDSDDRSQRGDDE